MNRIRVAIVGNLPKPFGGVATHCYYLAKELARKDIDVLFIDTHIHKEKFISSSIEYCVSNLSPKDIFYLIRRPFLLITVFRKILKFKRCTGLREMYTTIKTCLKILTAARKDHVDIIHSQHCLLRTLAAIIAGKILKKSVVITVHGGEFAHEATYKKYSSAIDYNVREADAVIAVSKFTKKKMIARGVTRKVYVVHNGVDIEKYYSIPDIQADKMKRNNRIVLTVAHLSKRKGIDVLLKSIPLIKTENVEAWIVGPPWDPAIMEELINLVKQLDIENRVIFWGEIPDAEIVRQYNMADVFILPTAWETEGFGLVNLEAMACGTPVIASNIGAIPDIVDHGKTGILVTPNKPQELARAIDSLIADRKKCMAMGKSGQEKALSSFSWGKMAEQTIGIYSACVRHGGEK